MITIIVPYYDNFLLGLGNEPFKRCILKALNWYSSIQSQRVIVSCKKISSVVFSVLPNFWCFISTEDHNFKEICELKLFSTPLKCKLTHNVL